MQQQVLRQLGQTAPLQSRVRHSLLELLAAALPWVSAQQGGQGELAVRVAPEVRVALQRLAAAVAEPAVVALRVAPEVWAVQAPDLLPLALQLLVRMVVVLWPPASQMCPLPELLS